MMTNDALTTEPYRLTTDHSASCYGIPVLVDRNGDAYGPLDRLPTACPFLDIRAAYDVAQWLESHALGEPSPYDPEMARAFLRSAPAADLKRHLPHGFDPTRLTACQ